MLLRLFICLLIFGTIGFAADMEELTEEYLNLLNHKKEFLCMSPLAIKMVIKDLTGQSLSTINQTVSERYRSKQLKQYQLQFSKLHALIYRSLVEVEGSLDLLRQHIEELPAEKLPEYGNLMKYLQRELQLDAGEFGEELRDDFSRLNEQFVYFREEFPISIEITVPDYINGENVYICGNLKSLGNWRRHKKMEQIDSHTYRFSLNLPLQAEISFKFSLGNWNTVEKGAFFEEIANHKLIVDEDRSLHRFQVLNFSGFGDDYRTHTISGNLRYHRQFVSGFLRNRRDIMVYLPPSYDKEPNRHYPVLYMQDGKNLFDVVQAYGGVEMQLDETIEELLRVDLIEQFIVVGIENLGEERVAEYTPVIDSVHGGGRAKTYLKFLVNELMPMINQTYRTKTDAQNTALGGASLGGLLSFYAAFEYPHIFGKIAAISPCFWWSEGYMLNDYIPARKYAGVRVWLDVGTAEGDDSENISSSVDETRQMRDLLLQLGYQEGHDLFYFEHEGASHTESSWSQRLHMVLQFLFGKNKIPITFQKNY